MKWLKCFNNTITLDVNTDVNTIFPDTDGNWTCINETNQYPAIFNGQNSINCNNGASLQIANGTIEAWIKIQNSGNEMAIIVKGFGCGGYLQKTKAS